MLYNLVLLKNTAYANTRMASIPPEVQTEWDRVFSGETMAKYGARWVVYCSSTWCSEEYHAFAVNTYTDIQARIAHMKEIEKTAWFQYAEVFNLLGTSTDEPQMPAFPNPIYQLFIARNNPLTEANHARETREEEAARDALWQESLTRTGSNVVLYCDSYWANEDYLGFGGWHSPVSKRARSTRRIS